jgi:hypothetical protein
MLDDSDKHTIYGFNYRRFRLFLLVSCVKVSNANLSLPGSVRPLPRQLKVQLPF